MNELEIQSNIARSMSDDYGGFGVKLNNKFVAGIPDLLLSCVATGPFFLEIKMIEGPNGIINLTPLQAHKIAVMQHAGCLVGVAAIEGGKGKYIIYVTYSPKYRCTGLPVFHKEIGKPWPLMEIHHALLKMREEARWGSI